MARYYRRRYTRVVKPKKKWASNFKSVYLNSADTQNPITLSSRNGFAISLASNSLGSSSPTPVIVKTGNFKCNLDVTLQYNVANSANVVILAFIMYLPEGVVYQGSSQPAEYDYYASIVDKHPEWIMAWKQIGSEVTVGSALYNLDRVSFSSRLKRNLNSGDNIALVVLFRDSGDVTPAAIKFSASTQFWTCAN